MAVEENSSGGADRAPEVADGVVTATGKEDTGCCPAVPIGRVGVVEEVPRGTVAEAEVNAMKRDGRRRRSLS
jgi:hypothetical protein